MTLYASHMACHWLRAGARESRDRGRGCTKRGREPVLIEATFAFLYFKNALKLAQLHSSRFLIQLQSTARSRYVCAQHAPH